MDRDTAEKLIELLLSLDEPLNKATELTEKIADAEERKAVRRAIGEITLGAYTGVIRRIAQQFPDLDPDKPRS